MERNVHVEISVIIPVYNAEKTLTVCVRSIVDQANDGVEIVLVDDGSADASPALCDALAEDHPESIRVIHQTNSGSFIARMMGASVAKGSYLLFVDADDVLLDGAIAKVREDITSGADLYIYDYIMDAVGGDTANTVRLMDFTETTEFTQESKQIVSRAFMKGMMNTVCATAIRRSFVNGLEFRVPEQKICNGEDRLHKLQLIAGAERIVYVPWAFYYYKWYPSTQGSDLRTGSFSAEIYEDFRLTWSIERDYYAALGFDREQCRNYDGQKLTRICSLLENSWCRDKLTGSDTDTLISQLSCDGLFCQLSSEEPLSVVRPHIRITASLIRSKHTAVLKIYWRVCHFVRRLRYGAKSSKSGATV